MSVRFVIGRAGSGKTAHLLRETVAACREDALGSPIVWIVPRQATFLVERDLCCGGELNGFFRVQVVSFELLVREILAEVGGAAASEVTHRGREMILGRLLRQNQSRLKYFGRVAETSGLAGEVAAALDELERAGEKDLAAIVPRIEVGANSALAEKMADLALIQSAYGSFLGKQKLDPEGRQRQALQAMERSGRLRAATIYVDGFHNFTGPERRMIVKLAAVCRRMEIAVTMDPSCGVVGDLHQNPDEMSLFYDTEMDFRKLNFALGETGVKVEKPLLLTEQRRFKAAGLAAVERWESGPGGEGIELIEATSKRAEVEAAARRICDWIAAGWRWRDVAVLSREMSEYHDLLEAVFAEHRIPYFVDQRRTAAHHPVIQFLRAVVEVMQSPWDADAMMSIIKSGLCGLTAQQADELENELLLRELRGSAWAQTKHELLLPIVNRLRELVGGAALARPVREWGGQLLAVMETFGVRATLSAWIAQSPPEEAQEHQQVWTEILELFDQLVELMGDQVVKLDEFASLFMGALSQFDLAIAPPTVDQVLVGQVDRTRTATVKGCVVLGLSAGQFPLPAERTSILNDLDRVKLGDWVKDLEPSWQRRALHEEFFGYFAFTRASERLVVTRATADDDARAVAGSSLWMKLCGLAQPVAEKGKISTARQLIGGLMQWARREGGDAEGAWEPGAYEWVNSRPASVESVRGIAWPALTYKNEAKISPELAGELFAVPLNVTARQLETFAACPFQHFLRYGLGLKARQTAQVDGKDIWRVAQDVLRRMGSEDDEQTLRQLVATAARQLKSEGRLDDARHRHLLDRMTRTLREVARTQRETLSRGEFAVSARGVRYGASGDMDALAVEGLLLVSGEMDRVDTAADAAVIHDYRLNSGALRLADIYYGLSLELVIHLLAWGQAKREPVAVAVLSSPMLRHLRDESPAEAEDAGLQPGYKARGLIDERFVTHFDRGLGAAGTSAVVAASRNKDGTFGRRDTSDLLTSAEFAGLLAHVERTLGKLAARITGGDIGVKPYRLGNQTPCVKCAMADVCRFDPREGYVKLRGMKRSLVLEQLGQ